MFVELVLLAAMLDLTCSSAYVNGCVEVILQLEELTGEFLTEYIMIYLWSLVWSSLWIFPLQPILPQIKLRWTLWRLTYPNLIYPAEKSNFTLFFYICRLKYICLFFLFVFFSPIAKTSENEQTGCLWCLKQKGVPRRFDIQLWHLKVHRKSTRLLANFVGLTCNKIGSRLTEYSSRLVGLHVQCFPCIEKRMVPSKEPRNEGEKSAAW